MDIYAKEGHKVVFLGENGFTGEAEKACRYLIPGEIYTVDHTEVYSWTTDVYLKECPDRSFNSVMFDDLEEEL